MFCPKCGAELDDNAKICNVCGMRIVKEDKIGYILSLISTIMVIISFNFIVNTIGLVIAITALVFTFIRKSPTYFKWSLGLSIFSIIGHIILIIFYFL